MKTNLEIDDQLAVQIESAAKARGISIREFMQNALRRAVEGPREPVAPVRFVQRVHDFGTYLETPWTILVDIESDEYVRKYNRK